MLKSLLLNIFIVDLFPILEKIVSFVDGNTPYTSTKNAIELINSLGKASIFLLQWFKDNRF